MKALQACCDPWQSIGSHCRPRRSYVLGCIALLWWLWLVVPAHAAVTASRPAKDLIRTQVSELGGWPTNLVVHVMVEDGLGRVWFGTPRGVWRYDGARVEAMGVWPVEDPEIVDLALTSTGRIYALTARGRLLEWQAERWIQRSSELPLRELAVDLDGALLLVGGRTLLKLMPGDRLEVHPAFAGRSGWAREVKTRHGRLWLLWGPTPAALRVHTVDAGGRLTPDPAFDFAGSPQTVLDFDVAADGRRVLWDGALHLQEVDGRVHQPPIPIGAELDRYGPSLLFDRAGVLNLCGFAPTSLARWRPDGVVESLAERLPHPSCFSVMEQRDGSLWVGSYRGPARFVTGPVWQRWLDPGSDAIGGAHALIRARAGGYWVASDGAVHRFADDGVQAEVLPAARNLVSVAESAGGVLHVADEQRVWRRKGSDWQSVVESVAEIRMIAIDRDDALWVLHADGVERHAPDGTVQRIGVKGANALLQGRDGTRWLAAEALYRLETDASGGWQAVEYWRPRRPHTPLMSLFEAVDGALWIATDGDGLWRLPPEGAPLRLGSDRGLPGEAYEWVVVHGEGAEAVAHAALRVSNVYAEVALIAFPARGLAPHAEPVPWRQIGRREGVIGPPVAAFARPTVEVDAHGRVWVAAAEGLAIIESLPWSVWSRIAAPQAEVWQARRRLEVDADGSVRLARALPLRLDLRLPDQPDPRLSLWYRLGEGEWQRSALPTRVDLGVPVPGRQRLELQARRAEGLVSPTLSITLDTPLHWHEQPLAQALLALVFLLAVTTAAVLGRQRWRERRRREAELSEELGLLSRFQRLVLACVVQGRGERRERIATEIGGLMQALDIETWVEQALRTLEARGLLAIDAGGHWRVAEPMLRHLPLARESLDSQLRAKRLVERFLLLEPIGKGGQAEVHRAMDGTTGRVVALKLLRGDALIDHELRERLRREAEALSALDHPGVVRLYAHGPHGADDYFLAMELIPGSTLAAALARQGRYAEAPARELLCRLREALSAIHASGIVHRDVKPHNLMLRGATEPVLIDFGLAQDLGRATRLTEFGQIVGTLQYMAPEQCMLDAGAIGPATDWWAFGVIAHELLLGYLPWDLAGLDESGQRLALLHPQGARRRAYPADFPAPWRALIDSCLEREPGRRQPDFRVLEVPDTVSC